MKMMKMVFLASLLAVVMMNARVTKAAIVNYDFSGTIDSGLLLGETYNGSFSYDNALLIGLGAQSLNLTSFIFNFLSSSYGLASATVTPTADFLNGAFLGISFTSLTTDIDPTFSFVASSGTGLPDDKPYLAYQTVSGDSGFGTLQNTNLTPATQVPLPEWLFGWLAGGLGLLSVVFSGKFQKA